MKELLGELCNSKINGIRHIARAQRKLSRFVWSVILFGSACACVFLIVGSLNEFQRYEVVTTSRLLNEETSIFPTVTICNTHPFTTEYSVSLVKKANISILSGSYQTIMLALERYFKNTTGVYMDNAEKRKLSNLDMTLNYCSFNNVKCNSSWFEWMWHTRYFGCYRFNSGRGANTNGQSRVDLLKSNVAGSSFRLIIDVYTGLPNEWSATAAGQSGPRGFYALIQNASDYPYGSIPSPIFITPSFGAKIVLTRQFYKQYNAWPYAYSECRVDASNKLIAATALAADRYLFDQVIADAGNYSYTQATCLLFCAQTIVAQDCNCSHNFLASRVPNVDVCVTVEEHECAESAYRRALVNRTLFNKNCLTKCPIECNRHVFHSSISYFQFPVRDQVTTLNSVQFAQAHANQTDFTNADSLYANMATVSVYYDRLSYEVNSEEPAITLDTLIGLIGGHLHLFLGMSLLSIVELVDIVVSSVVVGKERTGRNTKRNSHSELHKKTRDLRMDGLPNIATAYTWWLKIVWTTLFVCSLSGCAFLVVDSIGDFLRFEVTTDTRMESNQPNTAIFPTITICPRFPITTEYGARLYSRAITSSVSSTTQAMAALENYARNTTGAYMSVDERKLLNELIVVRCQIGERACNSSDFQWIWIPRFYGCYRFNGGFDAHDEPRELIRAGMTLGSSFAFSIELYSGVPDFLISKQAEYSQRGYFVFVQNSTDYPFDLTPSPTTITPGFGVEMLVERSFYSQLNEWPYTYSECRVDENNQLIGTPTDYDRYLFDLVVQTNYTYTRTTCFYFCAQLYTTRVCKCNNYDLQMRFAGYELCVEPLQSACASKFFYNEFAAGNFIQENCSSKCPLECHQNMLRPVLTAFSYPTRNDVTRVRKNPQMIAKYSKQTDFDHLLADNLAKLNVRYEPLSYTISKEKSTITVNNLISTLGGHLHLFLGMSLMSFLEIVELGIWAIVMMLKRKQQQGKSAQEVYEIQENNTQTIPTTNMNQIEVGVVEM